MNYQCTEESFLKDVEKHEMIIIRDDGIYRHIRFKKENTMMQHFDLITWPGYLCYTGDMGTYVFTRLRDMFEFFRTDREHRRLRDGLTLAINPGYWSEKVEAQDKFDGITEFSEERFKRAVLGDLVQWMRNNRKETDKEDRRDLWQAVMNEVLGADGDNGGYRQQAAAHDFYHTINSDIRFEFVDFFEHDVTEYSHRFMWCCYALAWGIEKFDKKKAEPCQHVVIVADECALCGAEA